MACPLSNEPLRFRGWRCDLYQAFQVGQGVIREINLRCQACPKSLVSVSSPRAGAVEAGNLPKPRFSGTWLSRPASQRRDYFRIGDQSLSDGRMRKRWADPDPRSHLSIKTRYGYWGDGSFLLGEGCSLEFVAPWIELGVALAPAFDIEVSSDWLYFGALAYPWM